MRVDVVWPLVVCAVALSACAVVARGRGSLGLLALSAVCVGVAAFNVRVLLQPIDALGPALTAHGEDLLRVEGRIVTRPERSEREGRFAPFTFQSGATGFRLDVDTIVSHRGERAGASGLLSVRVQGEAPDVRAGQRVRITGRAIPTFGATNPAPSSMLLWASQTGWAGALVTSDSRNVVVLDDPLVSVASVRAALQTRAGGWIDRIDASPEARSILAGALLGAEPAELADVRRTLERIGAAHVLAISGLHLAALAWLLLLALRVMPRGDRWAPVIVALVVLLYAWLVPARPAVTRATIMVLGFLLAESSGRRYDRLSVLAWTAVIVLLWRPLELTRPGFQLTFAVVAGLIALTEPLRLRLFGTPIIEPDLDSLRERVVIRAQRVLCGALSAWLIATPLLAHHFGIFNPLAPAGALLLAPVFSVVLGAGQAAVLLGVVHPALSALAAPIAGASAEFAHALAVFLEGVPGFFVRLPAFSPAFAGVFLALVCWWILVPRLAAIWRVALTVAFFFAFAGSLGKTVRTAGLGSDVALRIDTFDVGDGTCHLIRSGGEAILWDAGGSDLAAGQREIPTAIRELGAWRVRDAVITHANIDHYALLPDLIEPLGIKRVYVNRHMFDALSRARDGAVALLRDALAARGVEVIAVGAGDSLTVGDAALRFLWPPPDTVIEDANNTSLVGHLVITGGGGGAAAWERAVLLTGDVEDEAIALLSLAPVGADVMEAPHHGSARKSAMEWVTAIGPEVLLQSTGASRVGDERWEEVRARIDRWLTTATDGSVAVEVLENGELRALLTSEKGNHR